MKSKEKPTIKTYAVNGLIELRVELPTGYDTWPILTINFEGGQLTGYGVSPARFTTDDSFVQKLIEGSDLYKSKRIYLYKSVPKEENKKPAPKDED